MRGSRKCSRPDRAVSRPRSWSCCSPVSLVRHDLKQYTYRCVRRLGGVALAIRVEGRRTNRRAPFWWAARVRPSRSCCRPCVRCRGGRVREPLRRRSHGGGTGRVRDVTIAGGRRRAAVVMLTALVHAHDDRGTRCDYWRCTISTGHVRSGRPGDGIGSTTYSRRGRRGPPSRSHCRRSRCTLRGTLVSEQGRRARGAVALGRDEREWVACTVSVPRTAHFFWCALPRSCSRSRASVSRYYVPVAGGARGASRDRVVRDLLHRCRAFVTAGVVAVVVGSLCMGRRSSTTARHDVRLQHAKLRAVHFRPAHEHGRGDTHGAVDRHRTSSWAIRAGRRPGPERKRPVHDRPRARIRGARSALPLTPLVSRAAHRTG